MKSKILFVFALAFLLNEKSVSAVPVVENAARLAKPDSVNNEVDLVSVESGEVQEPAAAANLSLVHFYLFTKENPTEPQELFIGDSEGLANSNFHKNGPVKFMCHGFTGHIHYIFPWESREELLQLPEPDINIILLDWAALSGAPDYVAAVRNAYPVSNHSADFLQFILDEEATTLDKIDVIGYSLGGQVVGILAKRFTWRTGLVLPRVISLDPAFPLFDVAEDDDRISADDADFVQVVHTAGGTLGMVQPRGDVDFYPNGGVKQPGCGLDPVGACSHLRAAYFLKNQFVDKLHLLHVNVLTGLNIIVGIVLVQKVLILDIGQTLAKGKFYLRTNAEPPYALG